MGLFDSEMSLSPRQHTPPSFIQIYLALLLSLTFQSFYINVDTSISGIMLFRQSFLIILVFFGMVLCGYVITLQQY